MNENADSLIQKLKIRRDAIKKELAGHADLVKELHRLENILALEDK